MISTPVYMGFEHWTLPSSPARWRGNTGRCSGLVCNRPAARCKEAQCSRLQQSAPPVGAFELYSKLQIWINGGAFVASQSLYSSIYIRPSCCVISNNTINIITSLPVWSVPLGLFLEANKVTCLWVYCVRTQFPIAPVTKEIARPDPHQAT